jgi:hypothetical protein
MIFGGLNLRCRNITVQQNSTAALREFQSERIDCGAIQKGPLKRA